MLLKATPSARDLRPAAERLFSLSAPKLLSIEKSWNPADGAPVFTRQGRYAARGWTEWTQGFQFGSILLQFDATGETGFLDLGRRLTLERMASHVSHIGVHDHGFNNVSTYGNLWRFAREGKTPANPRERELYELALKVSGAIQAARWTSLGPGRGFIYSFNGPHSLFVDTVRSLRVLAVAHRLGHVLMGERDRRISLLRRLIQHAEATARYSIYYGRDRDIYDVRGRTVHECIFNLNDSSFRCPNTQQGYSPFSTWTRGLAWALTGFAEQLEFFDTVTDTEIRQCPHGDLENEHVPISTKADPTPKRVATVRRFMLDAARATADFYLDHTCADGIPMWDTGAPNLHRLGDYLARPSDPFNPWEPVDSSAAAIAAQGLLRLGNYLVHHGQTRAGTRYRQAAFTVAQTLFAEPYLSTNPRHQGLILHSVYHRPNGWDFIAPGQKVPNGESSIWGDYHARELALLILREARGEPYPTFF